MLAGADPYTDAYLDVYGIPFPLANLDLKYEILVNGTWQDITDFVFWGTDTVITVPKQDETTQASFTQATFMVNNADGRFSPENPVGSYAPYIARNMQLRISVGMDYVGASSWSGYRFWGESTSWVPGQDSTGNYQYAAVTACGVLRRYNQGAKIGSALRRYYSKLLGDPRFPYAAWPGEDAGSATEIGSMVTGVPGMTFTGAPQFASSTAFGGSDPIPVTAGSVWHGLTLAAESPPSTGSLTENSPGTYTWTCPPGVSTVNVANVGAGGGGGATLATSAAGGGGGGGGGSAANTAVAVTPGTTYTYVVPAGGQPGTTVSSGTAGGDAVFTGDSASVTAHGGQGGAIGGSAGGAGGAGGVESGAPVSHSGGAGGAGATNAVAVFTKTITGKGGAIGGGANRVAGTTAGSWTAPFSTTTVDVTSCVGAGGGGGGGDGRFGGGGGGGAGAFSAGTVNVTPGKTYAPYAGNGGNGGSGGIPEAPVSAGHGDHGGASGFAGDSSSSVVSGAGAGGGLPAGGPGGSVSGGGTGNSGGTGGTGASSASAYGGGGGGGAGAGKAAGAGDTGANGKNRAPGGSTLSGGGGKGGWGRVLTGSGAGKGQTAGSVGYANGGGGGGGGSTADAGFDGTNAGGGAPGSITWTWTNDAPTGGGGGSSGGTSANGNAGADTGAGGAAVTGGGAGGNMDLNGVTPGGGGGGQDPTGMAPGAGAPGQVSFSWNGGMVSPVPANYLRFLLDVPLSGETDGAVIVTAVCFGGVAKMEVVYHTAAGGSLEFIGYDAAGGVLFDSGSQSFTADGTPLLVSANTQTDTGSTIDWGLNATDQLGNVTSFTGSFTGSTLGNVSDVYVNPNGTLASTAVGWVTAQQYCDPIADMGLIISGYDGELMADRLSRLCGEEGVSFTLIGTDTDTPQMGPQQDDTFVNVLQSCEDVDRGLLFESADTFGLAYRTRLDMCGQSPAVIFDWSAGQLASPPPAPVTDDQQTRNDITLTRSGGSSATAVLNDGSAMSVSDPPNGVGDNTYALTVFLYQDSQLANMVAWMLTVGTVPGARYPALAEDLTRADVQSLTSVIPALGHGDWIEIVNPASQLTPGPIDQLLWGWTETLNSKKWTFAYNLVPEAPYASGPQVVNVNPDFATGDTTGWVAYEGTIAYDGSPPGGAPQPQAAVLTPNGTSTITAIEGTAAAAFSVDPSAQYLAEAWVYIAGSSSVELGIDWLDASSTYLSTASAIVSVPAGQWTYLTAILTSPDADSGVVYGVMRVGRYGGATAVSSGDTLEATAIQCIYPISVW